MRKIVIFGWYTGFEKVGFTKLFRSEFGYSLKSARETTNAVLQGQPVFLEVTEERYKKLACRLTELGAKIGVDE
jgi:ribosomal protein L7/L12